MADRLDRLAASDAVPQPTVCAYERRRPKSISQAVIRVLQQADQPMRTRDVHQAISSLLAEDLPYSAVKSCMAKQAAGRRPRLERVARGLYRLKR